MNPKHMSKPQKTFAKFSGIPSLVGFGWGTSSLFILA